MMHTRAFLLLEKEYMEYEESNIFGISITPVGDNLMEWIAEIEGLKDSLWEGAELQLSLQYNENYNKIPPQVNFNTIPFHPNVDPQSGRPCVDFLDDPSKWNPKYTMLSILLSIQVMLSKPVLNNAVNLEAAKMMQNNYRQYRQRVIQCVKASQHIEDIVESLGTHSSAKVIPPTEESGDRSQARKITAISYEKYYSTWFRIATSKAAQEFKTPVFDDPDFIGNHLDWTVENVSKGEWDIDLHRHIISGIIKRHKKQKLTESRAGSHLIPSPTPATRSLTASGMRKEDSTQDVEPWEKEVEDLIMWSASLDHRRWN
nr:PREDICTED: ubiquitin-conjugating enzyme E2 U [Anolis carolinensis]|eukprot:XP_003220182.2 PREDICTED: ubiquitin-conjugating enzyme E2 U [Anolis carolinensis]